MMNDGKLTLRQLRETHGYSQEQFAAKIGVTRNAYAQYEAGRAEPKLSNFLKIAKELNIPLKTLAKAMGYDITGIPGE
jgi:transcriptional regulator with XRE-family HTH domain